MTDTINIRLYFLRYKNYNSSRQLIIFVVQCHKYLILLSIAFATNSGIAAAIALLVTTIFIRVQYNKSKAQKTMEDFRTNQKAVIALRKFSSSLQKLDRLSQKLHNRDNKKVETRQKNSQNKVIYSF